MRIRLFFLFLLLNSATARAQTPLEIGVFEFRPLSHVDVKNARYTSKVNQDGGLFLSLLKYIAERENWTLAYRAGTYNEGNTALAKGELDLLVAVSYSSAADEYYDFTRETVISTWAQVYTREKHPLQSPLELNGLSIGVVRDDPYYAELRSIAQRFAIECDFVEFSYYGDVFSALANQWVDAGIVDRLYGVLAEGNYPIERTPILFAPSELRFAARQGQQQEVLAALDYHLSELKKDPHSEYYQLLNQVIHVEEELQLPRYLVWGIATGLGLLFLVGAMNVLLRRRVQAQMAELSHKNSVLENEIDMRRQAEGALRESNRLLNKTFGSMHDGLLVVSGKDYKIHKGNNAAARLFACELHKLVSQPSALDLLAGDIDSFKRELRESIGKRGFMRGEFSMRRSDGSTFPAEIVVTLLENDANSDSSAVVMVRDISERIRANSALRDSEARLRQAQKMEAIGTLAGGIAHDFNNILTPIIGFTELSLAALKAGKLDLEDYLEQVLQGAYRAKDLVAQILTFSRQKEKELRPLQLNLLAKETLNLLRASIPSTIEIRYDPCSEQDTVLADPTQMHQVIMNLCTNAAHALRDRGGLLELDVCEHEGPLLGWSTDPVLPKGRLLRLSVRDTGHGIPPQLLHRIFDPFFTTKKQGEGTGMGLSVAHGIIKSYGGAMSVETAPNKGSTFHVYLRHIDIQQSSQRDEDTREQTPRGTETVLLVDDEQTIVEVVEKVFEKLGYRVVSCTSSSAALGLFHAAPDDFDLVITDQTMPDLTGADLAQDILSRRPDLPIILCTGFSETFGPDQARALGIREYLMKPVSPFEMARIARRTIDRGRHRISHEIAAPLIAAR